MLELSAVVQIEAAMTGAMPRSMLTGSFTAMAECMRLPSETVQTLPDTPEVAAAKARLVGTSDEVSAMVHQAVIAFQF